ncbi:MAG: condensation domain-containing protein [Candidatus Bipolaricaulia bacterium]
MSNTSNRIDDLSPEEKRELLAQLLRKKASEPNPLSFSQERLWFLHQLEPDSPAYNIPLALRFTGPLSVSIAERSLNEIVRHHEVLRTTFSVVDGRPVQVIAPALTLPLPVVDLRELPETERETEVRRLATEEARRPFDLVRGPLLRVTLLRLGEEEYVGLLIMHHIVSDGWSTGVLGRELAALYSAFSTGSPSPLPELPIQYADFARWQRKWLHGEVLETQLAYWKQQLEGAPTALELPTDRPRPAIQTDQGARQPLVLPKSLTEALKTLSQQQGVTLFMMLLAAFNTLLYRYTGQDDIVVGSPIAGRNRVETEGSIGCFINMLGIRTDLSGNPTFRELLSRVREVTLGAYAHQDLPFEKLVEELQPERDLGHTLLFQVTFGLHNVPMPTLELPDLTLSPLEIDRGTAKRDLEFHLWERPEGLRGFLVYNTDLFDAATITRMLEHFQILLEGIVADPEGRISDLPLTLTEAEQQQLLVERGQNE